MFYRILSVIFPLFAIVTFAFFYGRRFKPDLSVANRVNMDVFLPALIFSIIVEKAVDPRKYGAFSLAILIIVVGSGLVAWLSSALMRFDSRTFVPPIMFGNAGNVGLPLFLLTFGEEVLPLAVLLIVIQNSIHFSFGIRILDDRTSMLRALASPLILVSVAAFALNQFGLQVPPFVLLPIKMLGQICIPLLLFALGIRLANIELRQWRIGIVGALLSPAVGIALALLVRPWLPEGIQRGSLVLFGALPPGVMNYMFAERYAREPDKVASIVVLGHLFAAAYLPLVLAYVLPSPG